MGFFGLRGADRPPALVALKLEEKETSLEEGKAKSVLPTLCRGWPPLPAEAPLLPAATGELMPSNDRLAIEDARNLNRLEELESLRAGDFPCG